MTWKIFAGDDSELYRVLLLTRARKDGFSEMNDGLSKCLRSHVNRGLTFLASGKDTKSISDFIERWADQAKR